MTVRKFHNSQSVMFSRARNWYDSAESAGVAVAPPGFGKTSVITGVLDYVAAKYQNAKPFKKSQMAGGSLMITPRLMLNKQQSDEIQNLSIEGLENVRKEVITFDCLNGLSTDRVKERIARAIANGSYPVIVSTYKSCDKLKDIRFDVIICDEGHNVTAPGYFDAVMFQLDQGAKRLFITATPKLNKGSAPADKNRGMWNSNQYGKFIYTLSYKAAIRLGFILPIKRIKIDTAGDEAKKDRYIVDMVIKSMNTMKEAAQNQDIPNKVIFVFNSQAEIKTIRDNWNEIYSATNAIVFTAYSEQNSFHVNGRKPHPVSDKSDIRDDFLTELRDEKQDCILAHIDTMGEGVDVTGITGCVLFSTGDEIRIIQNLGRAMRILPEDRDIPHSERKKKYAMLGIVAYNGETDSQSYIDGLARAMQAMTSRDFYNIYLSKLMTDPCAGSGEPDENGEEENPLSESQKELTGFVEDTQDDDFNIFADDGDSGEWWDEVAQKVVDLEAERIAEEKYMLEMEEHQKLYSALDDDFAAISAMLGM